MTFSYDEYGTIIKAILDVPLPIVGFRDVLDQKLKKFCVVRHDIEFSIERAYQLALIENKLGIKSTYTVQLRNNNYNALSDRNIGLVRDINDMGHDIGAHIHMGGFSDKLDFFTHASEYILDDANTLSKYLSVPIEVFAFHRPKPEWLELSRLEEFEDLHHGIINAYSPTFFQYFKGTRPHDMEVFYFADSNHRWKWGFPIDYIRGIYEPAPGEVYNINKMQLLCHPYSWTDTGYSNLENFKILLKEKDVENRESMKDEMLSFPKELL